MHENPDYEAYSFDCNGSFTSGGSVIHCYNNKRHGTESLSDSFANSCNSSYASIGLSLDANQFETLCEGLLFNKDLPVKFESSKSSFALSGDAGDSIRMETAIGQGKTLVTPMHMAMIASAIANDGVLMNPYVVDHTENYEGIEVDRNEPVEYGQIISEQDTGVLQSFMEQVVQEGTGTKLKGKSYTAAGKTGTAEFSTSSNSAHSWFVGYADREDMEDIAVAVIVEDSGAGSEYAVPVAKKIFDAYYGD